MIRLMAVKDGILFYTDDGKDAADFGSGGMEGVGSNAKRARKTARVTLTAKNAQAVYTLIQSLFWITIGLMFVFASLYLQNRGFSNLAIGRTLGCAYALSALLQPALSRLYAAVHISAEKAIRRVYGINIALTAALLLAPLPNALMTVLLVMIFSLGSALQPCVDTLALRWTEMGYPVSFSVSRGVSSLLYAGMTAGMGLLLKRVAPDAIPAFYLGTMSLCVIALMMVRIPEAAPAGPEAGLRRAAAFGPIIRLPGFLPLLCGIGCLAFGHALTDSYMLQIMQSVGGDSHDLGIAMAIASFTEVPAMWLFGRLSRRFGVRRLLVLSAWAWLAKSAIILIAPNPRMIYAAAFLQFCSYGLYIPAIVGFIGGLFPGDRNLAGQSFAGSAYTTGCVAATFAGGALLDAVGVRSTLGVVVAVTLAGALLFTAVTRQYARRAE